MAKSKVNSVVQKFNNGTNAFNRGIDFIRQEEWGRGEEKLKTAVSEMADSLEQALKIHLRGLGHDGKIPEEERQELKQPNFNKLMNLMERFSEIEIDRNFRSNLYAYREERNAASHDGKVPSIELLREMTQELPDILNALLGSESNIGRSEKDNLHDGARKIAQLAEVKIVGRDSEIESVNTVIAQSSSNQNGALITVAGVSGVGKTHFCRSICSNAEKLGFQVVSTACEPFQDGIELFPIRDILRQISGHANAADLVKKYFSPSSTQVNLAELAEAQNVDAVHRRDAYLATFANALYGRFQVRQDSDSLPILIFLDDMEWVDSSTVDALLCLRSRFSEGPVVILGAYRADLVNDATLPSHPIRPLIETMNRPNLNSMRLHFDGLPKSEISGVVEAIFDASCDLTPSHIERLYSESEGNPLFLREILYSLLNDPSSNWINVDNGHYVFGKGFDTLPIPSTIEEAVKARLSQIEVDQRLELERAAVIGRNFAYSIISELSDKPDETLDDNLEQLLRSQIIREIDDEQDTMFQFSHGKLRDVAYEQIPTFKRRRMHLQVAQVLQGLEGELGTDVVSGAIGRHFFSAGKLADAGQYLLSAARSSRQSFALSRSVEQYDNAISCFDNTGWPTNEEKFAIRLEHAEVLRLLGDYPAAIKIAETALSDASEIEAKGKILNLIGDLNWLIGNRKNSFAAYQECEEIARSGEFHFLILDVVADLTEYFDREAERLSGKSPDKSLECREKSDEYLSEQVKLAEQIGESSALARAYRNDAKKMRRNGQLNDALDRYKQAIGFLDDRVADHSILISYAKTLRLCDFADEAESVILRVLDWGVQTGARRTEGIARQYVGQMSMDKGKEALPRALDELNNSLSIFEELNYDRGLREVRFLLGEYYVSQGEGGKGLEFFSSALNENTETTDLSSIVEIVCSQLEAMDESKRVLSLKKNIKKYGNIPSIAK